MKIDRLKHMLIKEFIQIFRDPRMRTVVFVAPVVQLLVFSYAVNTDIRHVALAVCDRDRSAISRELVSRFMGSGYFDLVDNFDDESRVRELMDHGRAQAVLCMDAGLEDDVAGGKAGRVQILIDGTDSNSAGIILNYCTQITEAFSRELLARRLDRLMGAGLRPGPIEIEPRVWFNENLESRNYFVPGVIALLVTLITLLLTSMAVVREKEIGTMEQLVATPITPGEFILGKTLPFALIGLVDVVLIMVIGVFWFDIPMRGSLPFFFFCVCVFLMSSLGLGLFISTVSRTQQQAMMSTFFVYMPMVLFSGFIFPIANMPVVIQWLTLLSPLRYFLVIIRGVFLKGVGWAILWPNVAALAVIGLALLWLASSRVRKTVA